MKNNLLNLIFLSVVFNAVVKCVTPAILMANEQVHSEAIRKVFEVRVNMSGFSYPLPPVEAYFDRLKKSYIPVCESVVQHKACQALADKIQPILNASPSVKRTFMAKSTEFNWISRGIDYFFPKFFKYSFVADSILNLSKDQCGIREFNTRVSQARDEMDSNANKLYVSSQSNSSNTINSQNNHVHRNFEYSITNNSDRTKQQQADRAFNLNFFLKSVAMPAGLAYGVYHVLNTDDSSRGEYEWSDDDSSSVKFDKIDGDIFFETFDNFENLASGSELSLEMKPGFRNMGNTCFVNASTILFFHTLGVKELLTKPLEQGSLSTIPEETSKQFASRELFQKRTLELYKKWINLKSSVPSSRDLDYVVSNYLSQIENVCLDLTRIDLIGGKGGAKLRKDQGDANDFMSGILLDFLEFPNAKTDDGREEATIGLNVKEDTANDLYFADIFNQNLKKDQSNEGGAAETRFFNVSKDLIFHLRRYAIIDSVDVKYDNLIHPSYEISVPVVGEPRSNYNLVAVVVHSGSINSGHYLCYVFNKERESWIKYSDTQVTQVESSVAEVDIARNGYMFLYSSAN